MGSNAIYANTVNPFLYGFFIAEDRYFDCFARKKFNYNRGKLVKSTRIPRVIAT